MTGHFAMMCSHGMESQNEPRNGLNARVLHVGGSDRNSHDFSEIVSAAGPDEQMETNDDNDGGGETDHGDLTPQGF